MKRQKQLPPDKYDCEIPWTVVPALRVNDRKLAEIRKWCEDQEGNGKFFTYYTHSRWWFEREEDAILFNLVWGAYR